MVIEPKRMPFSVETYERMVASGVLDEDLRVELIDGEIIEMPPLSPDHSIPVQRLAKLFIRALGDQTYVRIEVARESRAFDRGLKLAMYARHRINEVWIVNVVDETFELYRDSDGERFQSMNVVRRGERASPLAFPAVAIAVDDVMTPAEFLREIGRL